MWLWSLGFAFIVLWVNSPFGGQLRHGGILVCLDQGQRGRALHHAGAAHIFGLGNKAVGLHNLYALPGGFFPHGLHGVWMAVILGLLSFIGIEVMAVTSGELRRSGKAIPAALRGMAVRLFLFYVLALGVVAALSPGTRSAPASR